MVAQKTLKTIAFLIVFLLSSQYRAQKNNTLDYYLVTAQQTSPNVQDLQNQIRIAALDSIKMQRDFGFKVVGIADASYAPQIQNWGYDGNSTINGKNLALLIRVSRDFVSKKNMKAKLSTFSLAAQQLLNQKNLSAITLKKAVTDQYLLAYENQEQTKIDREIMHIFEQEDFILKKLTQQSVFKQTDYLTFKVTEQQNELIQKQHLADFENNFFLLQYLSGSNEMPHQDLQPPVSENKTNMDFKESVYAQTFQTDSLKIANEIQLINYNYKPKIAVFADGGYSSALIQTPYRNFGVSAGLSLTVQLYDGYQRELSMQQKKIELDTRKNFTGFYKMQYDREQSRISEQINRYREMSKLAETQMIYARTLIEANLKQLPTGDVKMVDFILSVTNYTALKNGLLQYRMQVLKLENQHDHIILP